MKFFIFGLLTLGSSAFATEVTVTGAYSFARANIMGAVSVTQNDQVKSTQKDGFSSYFRAARVDSFNGIQWNVDSREAIKTAGCKEARMVSVYDNGDVRLTFRDKAIEAKLAPEMVRVGLSNNDVQVIQCH